MYSALSVFEDGEVRPELVIRELASYDWWGDWCEYVDGSWRGVEIERHDNPRRDSYIGDPLPEDPSFVGEYAHERQRDGFARWRELLKTHLKRASQANGPGD